MFINYLTTAILLFFWCCLGASRVSGSSAAGKFFRKPRFGKASKKPKQPKGENSEPSQLSVLPITKKYSKIWDAEDPEERQPLLNRFPSEPDISVLDSEFCLKDQHSMVIKDKAIELAKGGQWEGLEAITDACPSIGEEVTAFKNGLKVACESGEVAKVRGILKKHSEWAETRLGEKVLDELLRGRSFEGAKILLATPTQSSKGLPENQRRPLLNPPHIVVNLFKVVGEYLPLLKPSELIAASQILMFTDRHNPEAFKVFADNKDVIDFVRIASALGKSGEGQHFVNLLFQYAKLKA